MTATDRPHDYLPCPACHGRGLVPVDQVADIEAAERQRWAERIAADTAALTSALDNATWTRFARSYEDTS
jgi:hypothetical protein